MQQSLASPLSSPGAADDGSGSLVVCLSSTPAVCETITPDYVRQDTSRPPTFFECLGPSGRDIARKRLDENPRYLLRRVQCSIGNDPARLREQVESPRA